MAQAEGAEPGRPRSGRFGRLVTALAAGVAGGLIAPLIYPAVAAGARPAAKRAMKAGLAAFDRSRIAAAEFSEHASDLFAEARAEYDEEHKPAKHETPRAGPSESRATEIVKLRGTSGGREAAGP